MPPFSSDIFLSINDQTFGDLCGGKSKGINGIRLIRDQERTYGASVLITGHAGTGKTTAAIELCVTSLLANEKIADASGFETKFWPKKAKAVIFTLDQREFEIRNLIYRVFPDLPKDFVVNMSAGDERKSFDPDDIREESKALQVARIVIVHLPYGTSIAGIDREIDRYARPSQDIDDGAKQDPRQDVRIVLIDSINSACRQSAKGEDDGQYLTAFRRMLGHGNLDDFRRGLSTIVTYEADDKAPFPEEFLPQAVIVLDRDRTVHERRTIEIRKARSQPHFVGKHDFRIEEHGLKLYPNLATRARLIDTITLPKAELDSLTFGFKRIDMQAMRTSKRFLEGSATLLWGEPGTCKSDLLTKFLAETWRSDKPVGNHWSVLLITSKIEPNFVKKDLEKEILADENLLRSVKSSGGPDAIRTFLDKHVIVVDARNPFRLHSVTLTDVSNDIRARKDSPHAVKRAAIFGLSLLEEVAQVRDDQWRFLGLLVSLLSKELVSSLLIDWPVEISGRSEPTGPRARKLCSNEIFNTLTMSENDEPAIDVTLKRLEYTSIAAKGETVLVNEFEPGYRQPETP